MKIHQFDREQELPIALSSAWDFFSDPSKLDDITPPDLAFRTICGAGERMFAGQVIVHRIRILPLIETTWATEITAVEEQRYFIDEQRFGPYRFWQHLHRFEATDTGVRITDRVFYALPLDPFSRPAHSLLVRPQLEKIFEYRRKSLAARFGGENS